MSRPRFLLALTATALSLSSLASAAIRTESLGRRFELNDESTFFEGCINGLCMCPIALHEGLKGGFWIQPERGLHDFTIQRVELLAETMSGLQTFFGDGRYVIDGDMHRMTLNLSVKDGEPVLYDSGWVERPRDTPGIAVYLPMVEITCWGQEFDVHALPQQLSFPDLQTLGSAIGGPIESFSTIKARW
jgi:hypothetical protein